MPAETAERKLGNVAGSIRAECERFASVLEARPGFFAVSFTLIYCIGALIMAASTPYWLDEIITLHISKLPRVADIWSALMNATDGNPPLYYLLLRPFIRLLGEGPIVTRLPGIAAVWVAAVCVFLYVKKHSSAVSASIATMVFLHTGACRWAFEARPYAIVLGLAGVALICWQRCATDSERRFVSLCGLASSIACMVSTHYYSALMIVPLLCGEAVRFIARKRVDWPILFCIGIGSAFIAPWLPLLHSVRSNVAENSITAGYFAAPSLEALSGSYVFLLSPLVLPGIVCVAVVLSFVGMVRPTEDSSGQLTIPAHEIAAGIALAFFPVITYLMAACVTKTFVLRYVIEGALGLAILAGYVVQSALRSRTAVAVGVLAVLYIHFNFAALRLPDTGRPYGDELTFLERKSTGAVVLAEGLAFPPLWYYATPELRGRMFYLTDLEYARRTTDTTNENIMIKLKPMAPQSVVGLGDFISAHKEFSIYYKGTSPNSSVDELLARSCNVELAAKEGLQLLFRATCK